MALNIVKLGGSVINPDGKYDLAAIARFINTTQQSKDKFIFIVGGGKLCRFVQTASKPFLEQALHQQESVSLANDELGIAVTKINARFLLEQFQKVLGSQVHPQIILDPSRKVSSTARIFFACGWKPGCSTDHDMMLLANAFRATRVFKISNFTIVKDIAPATLASLSPEKQKEALTKAQDLPSMTWKKLESLIGKNWSAGMNTPFDPHATQLGLKLSKTLTLYIGQQEEFFRFMKEGKFKGTVVKR
ncbi:hypothetical protein HYV86_07630 [Candidatus Woesearchaeota archaeon]|nr:hypothetical protein [Candidatus Woesearchaeota archaeon]